MEVGSLIVENVTILVSAFDIIAVKTAHQV